MASISHDRHPKGPLEITPLKILQGIDLFLALAALVYLLSFSQRLVGLNYANYFVLTVFGLALVSGLYGGKKAVYAFNFLLGFILIMGAVILLRLSGVD